MKTTVSRLALICVSLVATTSSAAGIYNANAAFATNEQSAGTQTNSTFGPFTVGWGNTIPADGGPTSALTPFATGEFTGSFAGNGNTQGFQTLNNVIVPAAAVNDLGVTSGSGFAGLNPQEIILHPGGRGANGFAAPIYNGVLEFTAPIAGIYSIAGQFRSLDSGSTVDEIGVNGGRVFAVTDPAGSPTGTAYPFSFSQFLHSGDKVDFAVNQGADGIGSDSTGLTVTLTTPEPSSFILGGLSVIGVFIAIRGRRKIVGAE